MNFFEFCNTWGKAVAGAVVAAVLAMPSLGHEAIVQTIGAIGGALMAIGSVGVHPTTKHPDKPSGVTVEPEK